MVGGWYRVGTKSPRGFFRLTRCTLSFRLISPTGDSSRLTGRSSPFIETTAGDTSRERKSDERSRRLPGTRTGGTLVPLCNTGKCTGEEHRTKERKRRPFVRRGVAGSAGGMPRCRADQTAVNANQKYLKCILWNYGDGPFRVRSVSGGPLPPSSPGNFLSRRQCEIPECPEMVAFREVNCSDSVFIRIENEMRGIERQSPIIPVDKMYMFMRPSPRDRIDFLLT